jgi:hypothetical protein
VVLERIAHDEPDDAPVGPLDDEHRARGHVRRVVRLHGRGHHPTRSTSGNCVRGMPDQEIRPAVPADTPAVKAVTDAAYEH